MVEMPFFFSFFWKQASPRLVAVMKGFRGRSARREEGSGQAEAELLCCRRFASSSARRFRGWGRFGAGSEGRKAA